MRIDRRSEVRSRWGRNGGQISSEVVASTQRRRLDRTASRWQSFGVAIIFFFAAALVAGMVIRRRWALLLPLAVGLCGSVTIAATGHALGDTPIPFLVVMTTLVMAEGQGLGSRRRARILEH